MLYWLLRWVFLGPLLRLVFCVSVEGVQNVPQKGGALLVANHPTNFDSLLIGLATPRPIGFMAKSTLFKGRGPLSIAVRAVMSATHQIPVERQAGKESATALSDSVAKRLRGGGLVGIHPEGTCPQNGRLHRFRAGVGHIARRAQCDVIPVGIVYGGRSRFSWRRQVVVRIGTPIRPHQYIKLTHSEMINLFTERVRTLTGQIYVHEFAQVPGKRQRR